MRNLLFCIAYNGTAYHGWQVQTNAVSVQQRVQDAVETLFGTREDISGCSRTDAGVHANRYYFHMKTDCSLTLSQIFGGMNTYLPPDIALLDVTAVPLDFHARYRAIEKEYIYQIWNKRAHNPFLQDFSWHIRTSLAIEPMQEALSHLLGTHDFSTFCAPKCDIPDKTRTITQGEILQNGGLVTIRVRANGFLYNMVRIIVGTLYFVSQGKILASDIPQLLKEKNRNVAGKTAPAKGLFLQDVFYDRSTL